MANTKRGAALNAANRLGLPLADYDALRALGLKRCTECEQWRALADFDVDKMRPDGRAYVCKTCRRPSLDRPGKAARRKHRAAGEDWCRRCEKWLPAEKVHAGLCRPHVNEERRDLYASNAEFRFKMRNAAYERKRRVSAVPPIAEEMLREEFEGLCAYCQKAPATTYDHIVAVKHGGRTTPGNIVPACKSCNSSKGEKDVFDWMEARGFWPPSDNFTNRYMLSFCGLYG